MALQPCPHCGHDAKLLSYGDVRKLKCSNGCGVIDLCSTSESTPSNGAPEPPPVGLSDSASTDLSSLSAASAPLSNGHSNGNGYTNGHYQPPPAVVAEAALKLWQGRLLLNADAFLKDDPEYHKPIPARDLLEPLISDLTQCVEMMRSDGKSPPVELGEQDIKDEVERVARLAIEHWANTLIWSKETLPARREAIEPAALPVAEFEERAPIDAFVVWEGMKGEVREYALEGLIREGCTAVLSGLMGSGKTTLAMNISRAWALGEMVIGRQCKQSRTLVVVSPKEFEAWADTIGFWGLKSSIYIVESTKAHFGDPAMTVGWFDHWMRKLDCRTFVLDTLFDFFGMPPNRAGDSNRIAMNEQTPLLQCVREKSYAGLILGHAPKSEAKAIDPRDPEEAFGGHSAWTAQHRMRMTVRRKSQGVNAFITGRGGHGDRGILKEEMVLYDESTRLITLGGLFSEHMGSAAMPEIIDLLGQLGGVASVSKMVTTSGKAEKWIRAGLKQACKQQLAIREGKGRSTRYVLRGHSDQDGLFEGGND